MRILFSMNVDEIFESPYKRVTQKWGHGGGGGILPLEEAISKQRKKEM